MYAVDLAQVSWILVENAENRVVVRQVGLEAAIL